MVGAVEETDEENLRATMETMFFGPVRLTRAVLPKMRATGQGTIVQITEHGGPGHRSRLRRLQAGDPEQAAHAIVEAVMAGSSVLRLPLGDAAIEAIRAKLERIKGDVDRTEATARTLSF